MPHQIPSISIVTVCLNASATLRRAIDSVLSQTTKPHEYIIIDGGSTDGTFDIIKEYRSQLSHVVSERDAGISDAFNKGIRVASGDVIGILNADDWYEPDAFQLVSANIDRADVLHGNLQYWRGGRKDYLAVGGHSKLHKEMTIHHPTVFVRNAVYRECGSFRPDYRYAMDYELLLRVLRAGKRFSYLPATLANMSFDGASDVHWREAIAESARAKIDNGQHTLSSNLYYAKQISRSHIARALKCLRFTSLLRLYRQYFSVVRKY